MCDEYLGRLLDAFDRHGLWEDTCLVLSTDHGFMLSEHEWWGKCRMPYYEEITHIPLIAWHPQHADKAGQRRQALTWTPDLMPTMLEAFGIDVPPEVRGRSIWPAVAEDIDDGRTVGLLRSSAAPSASPTAAT